MIINEKQIDNKQIQSSEWLKYEIILFLWYQFRFHNYPKLIEEELSELIIDREL